LRQDFDAIDGAEAEVEAKGPMLMRASLSTPTVSPAAPTRSQSRSMIPIGPHPTSTASQA
jgi:hypothetical protein